MTKELRDAAIKSLVSDKHSGFTEGDAKMLEAAGDERLESFKVAAQSRAATEAASRAAAAKPRTSEEWMAEAPAEVRALIDRQKRQETERKVELVTALKAAQDVHGETALAAMGIDDLEQMARMLKLHEPASYEGRGFPSLRAAIGADDPYANPANPWSDDALAKHRAAQAH